MIEISIKEKAHWIVAVGSDRQRANGKILVYMKITAHSTGIGSGSFFVVVFDVPIQNVRFSVIVHKKAI